MVSQALQAVTASGPWGSDVGSHTSQAAALRQEREPDPLNKGEVTVLCSAPCGGLLDGKLCTTSMAFGEPGQD